MEPSELTSAQIISEARASLKSTRVSRPVTPAPSQLRSLWGDVTEEASNDRPPSVLKMSRVPFATAQKRPSSGVRLIPLSQPLPPARPPPTSHPSRSRSAKLIRKSHSLDQFATPPELTESLSMLDLYTDTPYLDWKVDRLKNMLAAIRSYLLSSGNVVTEQLVDRLVTPLFRVIQMIHSSSLSNTHLVLFSCHVAMLVYGRAPILSRVHISNISTICQLTFSLSRDEENDVHFSSTECADGMLVLLQAVNKDCIPEYLIYLLGTLKLITTSPHCPSSVTERFLSLSIQLADYLLQHIEESTLAGPCLLQIVWSFRNLCDNKLALLQLTTPLAVLLITNILNLRHKQDIVLYAAKVCSTLATNQLFHHSVMSEVSSLSNLLSALSLHSSNHPVTSRLAFTLSSLVMDDVIASSRILAIPRAMGTILQTVDKYSDLSHDSSKSCLPALTSLIGNLSLHPEAGQLLSTTPALPPLLTTALDTLTPDLYQDSEFPTALLTALNNLSFYQLSIESSVQLTRSLVNQLLIPSLSLSLIQQIVSCLGNLTRILECRSIVRQTKTDLFLLALLDSADADILFSTTGVIINLTSGADYDLQFIKNGIIDQLVGLLETVGLSDVQVLRHTCQILWNLSDKLGADLSEDRLQFEEILNLVTEYVRIATLSLSDDVIPFVQEGNKLISKLSMMLSNC